MNEALVHKNLCISHSFLLKYWAQNCACGLYTRLFVHGVVKLMIRDKFLANIDTVLVSRLPFVNYYLVTKQMFSCD